jgi:hypothetical protein
LEGEKELYLHIYQVTAWPDADGIAKFIYNETNHEPYTMKTGLLVKIELIG